MFEKMPEISVVIPTYNRAGLVREALLSVLHQTFQDFEVIVVDDGSTDNTREQVVSFQEDDRVTYIYQENQGPSEARNTGIRASKGKYVALLDDDDIALPQRLERQFNFLERNKNCALLGTACHEINEDESILRTIQLPSTDIEIRWTLLFNSSFVHSSVMLRKEALLAVGSYISDDKYSCVDDYELWSRLSRHYQAANLPEVLLKYRKNPLGISIVKREIQEKQSILVSAQNISALLERTVDNDNAEKLRLLYTGNITAWRFGVRDIGESLCLFEEINSKFRKFNWNNYKKIPNFSLKQYPNVLQTHYYAVAIYIAKRHYLAASQILMEMIWHHPIIILSIRFRQTVFNLLKILADDIQRKKR